MMAAEKKKNSPGAGQASGAGKNSTDNIPCSFLECKLEECGLTREHADKYGLKESKQNIEIPYYDPASGEQMKDAKGRPFVRTRLAEPIGDMKYKSQKGAGIRCYVPADTHRHLTENPGATVVLTEGEFKAIKATEDGLPTIGLGGIWLWIKKQGSSELHPDIAKYAAQGREFLAIWDSDATSKADFDRCTLRLSQALAEYGCTLYRLDLPQVKESGKTGLDDFLVYRGLSELTAVIGKQSVHVPPYMAGTDAESLMGIEFPPIPWVVPNLLPDGLSLLAGKSKLGKSWLALNLALAVGHGGSALGKLSVDRGEVLYLALEDNLRRLQQRLQTLQDTEPPPSTVNFWTELPGRDLHKNLAEIGHWLTYHADARLVVIDTLQRLKPPQRGNGSAYEEDTVFMTQLHRMALDHGVAILFVHHTRKADSQDPFDMVLGSTGLMGVADTTLLLTRGRGEADGKLQITGRDVGEQEYALRMDNGAWTLLGDAKEYEESKAAQKILDIIKEQPMSSKELAKELGCSTSTVNYKIKRLRNEGIVDTNNENKHFHI